ncbi:hypothetical protein Raf01_71660 [Rugosimonospora africana]|uniref:Uncharacterized protein n=1 Tax=Rugosimonospora africana TaxID=556532 RepID=A0A8J3QXI1_9ACTN|nr:hypothetical protein Raf01_71660 [Rugosimonospora africana]
MSRQRGLTLRLTDLDELAHRHRVSFTELADYEVLDPPSFRNSADTRPWFPSHTPDGRPLRLRPMAGVTIQEIVALVAHKQAVHVTVAWVARHFERSDVVVVPLDGLPTAEVGLIWCTARENGRICALADIAASRNTADANAGRVQRWRRGWLR